VLVVVLPHPTDERARRFVLSRHRAPRSLRPPGGPRHTPRGYNPGVHPATVKQIPARAWATGPA